jgi:hypothetical protein
MHSLDKKTPSPHCKASFLAASAVNLHVKSLQGLDTKLTTEMDEVRFESDESKRTSLAM